MDSDTLLKRLAPCGLDDGQCPEMLVKRTRGGDKDALEKEVRAIQNPVYGLAIRMLGDPAAAEDGTQEILIKEITRLDSLLSCLDREQRLAYILGEHLELTGVEGGQVLGVEPATFRKRLSRARSRMESFMRERCGPVRASNECQCERWVELGVQRGVLDPAQPHFASACGSRQLELDRDTLEGLDESGRIVALFRGLPEARAPEGLLDRLTDAIRHPPEHRPNA